MDGPQTQRLTGADVGSIALALANVAGDTGQAEQWIHLLPTGNFQARDGRGPWMVDNPKTIMAASIAYAGAKSIPVDYEHQTDLAPKNGQPAPAAGWIKQLQARADGIWGLVEWTERARAFLVAKEYRYLSPVFNHAPSGEVIRILRAALTNNPALELTALATTRETTMQTIDPLSELRDLLGLAADADMAAILQKVRDLIASAGNPQPDPARFVSIEAFQEVLATMQTVKREADEATAESMVEDAIDKARILPMHRELALELCRSDRQQFKRFVDTVSPFLAAFRGTQTGGLPPESRGASRASPYLDDTAKAICKALRHSADEFNTLGVANHAH